MLRLFKTLNKKLHTPLWLFVLLFVVLVLRIPSFFEPYSYGDELIYLTLGEAIRQGIPLYKGVHDNKPPLLYILAAIAGNLFLFKAILTGWHIITVFIFWKLTQVIFSKSEKSQIIATSIFAIFTTIPLLEGNIINSELFMIGPIILGFYILLSRKLNLRNLLFSGMLFSLAALFKVPAAFDFPVIFFYWLLTEKELTKKRILVLGKKSIPLIIGFALPIIFTFVWFFVSGSFKEYLIAAFLQNFGYLSSFRPGDIEKPFLVKNGPLLIRGLIVLIAIVVLYLKRRGLSRSFIFVTIWLFFSLFAVALSERPYPHYLIQSVPPIAILATKFFTNKKIEQIYVIVPLFFAFLVPFYYKFWYYPTTSYYQKFIKLMTAEYSKEEYFKSYNGEVSRNYKIAQFIVNSTYKNERIFVWEDGVQVYALSRRLPPIKYVAGYHIKDFSSQDEVIKQLEKNLPSMIVVHRNSESFPGLNILLNKNYGLAETIDGSEIWKLLSPRIRSQLSL